MPNPSKFDAVAKIKQLFAENNSYFVTDYQGLNVTDMNTLRSDLRAQNVRYVIAKNTLIKIAAKEAGVVGLDDHLSGPTAIAFTSDDPAAAAKVLNDSFKDKELPRMKVFIVEEEVFEGDQIKRLADLPTKEVLYSQVAASVEAPFTELIRSLDAFFTGLVGTIDALAEKKKSEG